MGLLSKEVIHKGKKVRVEELGISSHIEVRVQCDDCKKPLKVGWVDYLKSVEEDGKYYCKRCAINGYKKWVSFYEWCYINLSKEVADRILSRWDDNLNVDKYGNKLTSKDVSYGSDGLNRKGYWFKCLDHPEHLSELKSISSLTNNKQNNIDCHQCNALAITHPYLIVYLVNKDDIYKYSKGMHKKVFTKCPNCGYEKEKSICDLVNRGFYCPKCSDGVPYPEKFMYNFLEQLLNKEFEVQLSKTTFKWCKNYKYDNYIKSINCIIETHGIQHYKETTGFWGKLSEIQNNDIDKEELAKNNGIKNYIIIDCSESELESIKNNIMQSKLPDLLNFKEDDIDWKKCHEYACCSLVKVVCDLWNEGIEKQKINNILKLSKSSVLKYLNQGFKIGWCNYNGKEISKNNLINMSKNNCKQVICLTTGEIFNSIVDAGRKHNIKGVSSISSCCGGKLKSAGKDIITGEKLVWKYYINEQDICHNYN